MTDPKIMCRPHLLGEHKELHMFVGAVLKGKTLTGYAKNDLLEPLSVYSRHRDLVAEMRSRGYQHWTPIDADRYFTALLGEYPIWFIHHHLDRDKALKDLLERCQECKGVL